MSVTVTQAQTLTIAETLSTNVSDVTTPLISHTGFNVSKTLNSGSTPAATLCAVFQKALSSGTTTIDLTSLTGTNGATVSFNGLKVCACSFRNPAANANPITITFGASLGYLLLGSGFLLILKPGDSANFFLSGAPTVSGSLKNIDLAGTLSQALDCVLVAG